MESGMLRRRREKNKEKLSDQGMVSTINKLNPNMSPGQHHTWAKRASLYLSRKDLVLAKKTIEEIMTQ